jgi:hypothetical protein
MKVWARDRSAAPLAVIASAALRERPTVAGCASGAIGGAASFRELFGVVALPKLQ